MIHQDEMIASHKVLPYPVRITIPGIYVVVVYDYYFVALGVRGIAEIVFAIG